MEQDHGNTPEEAPHKKILVPVSGSMNAVEVERISFWLARNGPSELRIVEVFAPPTFFEWLLSPLTDLFRKGRSRTLREVQSKATSEGIIVCNAGEMKAPSLLLGIVEAARSIEPDSVILAPALRERLKAGGINELTYRLSEIGTFVLILAERGPAMRVVPCRKKDASDSGRVISIKRDKWTA